MEQILEQVAKIILSSKKGLAFTGAGLSTASGIPDFRSNNGIWSQYNLEEYAYINAFVKNPKKVWDFFLKRKKEFEKAEPNPAHFALAELEEKGFLDAVLTQNIDLLHQRAGSKNVFELHGSMGSLKCLNCLKEYQVNSNEYKLQDEIPYCECSNILKPGVVMFGEALPQVVFADAMNAAENCNFMIVAGTSAVVYPAAQIPKTAKRNNAYIIEINNEETPLTRSISDYFLKGKVEEILPSLVHLINI